MISSLARSSAPRTSRPGHRGIARMGIAALGAAGILVATSGAAGAQTAPEPRSAWEFLVSSGQVVPTGGQRDAIKRANLTAAQVSYAVRPALAVTATLGWARSRDIASDGDPKLDVFTYDLGAELRSPRWTPDDRVTVRGFAGLGAGVRSYDYRSLDVDATHNRAAYGSVGGELGIGRVGLRLEVRDYATGFKPLSGGGSTDTRNDVAVLAGLRIGAR